MLILNYQNRSQAEILLPDQIQNPTTQASNNRELDSSKLSSSIRSGLIHQKETKNKSIRSWLANSLFPQLTKVFT